MAKLFWHRLKKLLSVLISKNLTLGIAHSIIATTEHLPVLKSLNSINTFIDIGANKGQFALAARHAYSKAKIISFEPLSAPAAKFIKFFQHDTNILLHQNAIGPQKDTVEMHVSNREDSSSLLNIGENQSSIFPGTKEKSTEEINVAPLSHFLTKEDLIKPVLVKIDVQGFELEVLKGSVEIIENFDYIYMECSFIELYEGQALADKVIIFLDNYSFQLKGIYNTYYDKKGIAIQADFLFSKGV